jgi:hypothetical protein
MLLWLAALIIAVAGVVQPFERHVALAIGLFVIACLVGPGGYRVFDARDT